MPALLILQNRYFHRSIWSMQFPRIRYIMRDLLSAVVISGRYIWIISLFLVAIGASFVSYSNLSFPQYNPLQLFVSSNEHEWFDNNVELLFEFAKNKFAIEISIRLVWGLKSGEMADLFDLNKRVQISYDHRFVLNTTANIEYLAKQLEIYRNLDFIQHESPFWPERFLTWSRNVQCIPGVLCCNRLHESYNDTYTDYCIRISTAYLYTQYNDTPIYDNVTYELVGYTALLPTKLPYSHKYKNLSHSFGLIRDSFYGLTSWFYFLFSYFHFCIIR